MRDIYTHCISQNIHWTRKLVQCKILLSGSTMGVISEAGTAYPSRTAVFTSVFSGVHVTRHLVFCVVFCRSSFCHFVLSSLSHCVVYPSANYGILLLLWYLQTLLWKYSPITAVYYVCIILTILFFFIKMSIPCSSRISMLSISNTIMQSDNLLPVKTDFSWWLMKHLTRYQYALY